MDDDVDLRTMCGSEDLLKNKSCWHGGREPVTDRRMEELGSIYAKKMSGLYRVGNLWGFLLALYGIINSNHHFLLVLRIQSIWVHLYVRCLCLLIHNFSTNPMRCLYLRAEKINEFHRSTLRLKQVHYLI